MKEAVIIFVRNPERGKVKTRLAKEIGDYNALQVYIKLLRHTKDITAELTATKFVFSTGLLSFPWPASFNEIQSPGDLGVKMSRAFQSVFSKGYSRVLIIGSDCLELTKGHIENAFAALNKNDIVIGPATDGGYYLLGMKKLHEQLFENKSWSTEKVFKETMESVNLSGLCVFVLECLADIDTAKDLPLDWKKEITENS